MDKTKVNKEVLECKKERMVENLIEMIKIYSPSKKEGEFAKYLS